MDNEKKKDNRGGSRGGGRPSKGRVNLTFRADKDVVSILSTLDNKADFINNAIREYYNAKV